MEESHKPCDLSDLGWKKGGGGGSEIVPFQHFLNTAREMKNAFFHIGKHGD